LAQGKRKRGGQREIKRGRGERSMHMEKESKGRERKRWQGRECVKRW